MSKYTLYPVTHETPAKVFDDTWNAMVSEGKDKKVFWDGAVTDVNGWVMRLSRSHPIFVWDNEENRWCFLAWFDVVQPWWAWAHFCVLGMPRREPAREVFKLAHSAGIQYMGGIIPEWHWQAQRFVKLLGWKRAGTLPAFCDTEKGRSNGVIYHHRIGG